MKITLTNNFHNSSVNLNLNEATMILTPSQVKRAGRVLCGINGCTCGDMAGTRGHQDGIAYIEFTMDEGARIYLDTETNSSNE